MNTLTTIRPELLTFDFSQFYAMSPYFWVFGGAILAIILAMFRKTSRFPVVLACLAALAAGLIGSFGALRFGITGELFNRMMVVDTYSSFFNLVFLAAAALTIMSSLKYLDRENLQHPEYYILLLFATIGMMMMASALDLIVLFIALEIMSLCVYILVGFRRADRRCNEAAMKYFILGSAASAILLYGAALLYGATGSTNIHEILAVVQARPDAVSPIFVLGSWFIVLGFLFKVALVPFHMWMPDVYEGAPAPVTGFMTTGLKAAAFATFVRVFVSMGYGKGISAQLESHVHDILWVIAVLTMVLGNVVALTQTNLKRMLAYSSIAHSGYILVGLIAAPNSEQGYAPVVLYLVVYAIMNLGAFIILTVLASREDSGLNLHDISGLARRKPGLAFAMAVFMFSMAGVPPTAGFAGKYLLFYSAIQAHEIPLVIISVLCSAISVYYYLRVLVFMYMRDPAVTESARPVSAWSAVALALMVAMTVQIGVLPAKMVDAAKKAVVSL